MKSFLLPLGICSLYAGFTVGPQFANAQPYPPPPITKDGTAVLLADFANLPPSSRTPNGFNYATYPPAVDFAQQLSRVNFLRSEPSGAPLAAMRFFVCDLNRNFYVFDKSNKTFRVYLDFEAMFSKFDNNPGFAGGLVTFQFDPDYTSNGIFYTVHTEDPAKGSSGSNPANPNAVLPAGYAATAVVNPPVGSVVRQGVLVEWTDTNIANATFEGTVRELLRIGFNGNSHPMGDLIFNPLARPGDADYRNLYIACGDGAAGEQTDSRHDIPQRLDSLPGKILRITPDLNLRPGLSVVSPNGRYRIPASGADPNPFVTTSGARGEIFTVGHRNPHRLAWDAVSNTLLVFEIGLSSFEEINLVRKGANYGYADRDGTKALDPPGGSYSTAPPGYGLEDLPQPDTLPVRINGSATASTVAPRYPVAEYFQSEGDAMANGFVYRGTLLPELYGKCIFGDITTARLFYCDLAEMIAADDANPATLATIHELQVVFDSPTDSPDQGAINRRLFDIVRDEYHRKGGTASSLPGVAATTDGDDPDSVPYGGGRADIRLAQSGDGELYLLSKSDGSIRQLSSVTPRFSVVITDPVEGATLPNGLAITVRASASNPGGSVTQVQFFANGLSIGTDLNAPFQAGWTPAVGSYGLKAIATGNSGTSVTSAVVNVTIAAPGNSAFLESGGLVVMEAEHYETTTTASSHAWVPRTDRAGFFGESAMQALPNSGLNISANIPATSPVLTYRVQFTNTGTYNLWVRGFGANGSDDSVYLGVNGQVLQTLSYSPTGVWMWRAKSVTIATADVQVINVWMREDGAYVDRLLLTKNLSFAPTGNGPAESPRSGGPPQNTPPTVQLTSPASNTNVTVGTVVTLAANASDGDGSISQVSFRADGAELMELYVDSTAPYSFNWTPPEGTYEITAVATDDDGATTVSAPVTLVVTPPSQNQPPSVQLTSPEHEATFEFNTTIPMTADAADADGSVVSVAFYANGTLLATDPTAPYATDWTPSDGGGAGYQLIAVAQDNSGNLATSAPVNVTIRSPPSGGGPFIESGGLVVMEAEHFGTLINSGGTPGHYWGAANNVPGFVGDAALQALPNVGANINTGITSGSPVLIYPVQFTRTGTYKLWIRGWGDNGSDDSVHLGLDGQAPQAMAYSSTRVWMWRAVQVTVASAGLHEVNVWMREDGAYVDRLLLTTNLSFTPTGNGPAESARSSSSAASRSVALPTLPPNTSPLQCRWNGSELELSFSSEVSGAIEVSSDLKTWTALSELANVSLSSQATGGVTKVGVLFRGPSPNHLFFRLTPPAR